MAKHSTDKRRHSARRTSKPKAAISIVNAHWLGGGVVNTGTASYECLCKRLAELRQETLSPQTGGGVEYE